MTIKNCVIKHAECENALLILELKMRIAQLEHDLADVDQLLSCHQHMIDSSPRIRWPRESILGKAVDRHATRVCQRLEKER